VEKRWSIKTKIPMVLLAIVISIFFVLQIYVVRSTNRTPSQKYEVIESGKEYEIRFYPAVTLATITSEAKSYRQIGNFGFKKLATYIFGGNHGQQQIGMTTPVHMEINDTHSFLSFVMPPKFTTANSPQPYDSAVRIKAMADQYVAVIQFEGFISNRTMMFYTNKLQGALKRNAITHYGNFRFLGYNPPYQLVSRKNEVIVAVNWDKKTK
jgi:SOUL heme-binding protein